VILPLLVFPASSDSQIDWEVREVELEGIQQQHPFPEERGSEILAGNLSADQPVKQDITLSKQLQQAMDLNRYIFIDICRSYSYLWLIIIGLNHRYRKTKIDCLMFVLCPLLAPVFQGFFCCGH
jgi:hypothetical protein